MKKWESSKVPYENRAKFRSKTFRGIAEAMAAQWSKYLLELK